MQHTAAKEAARRFNFFAEAKATIEENEKGVLFTPFSFYKMNGTHRTQGHKGTEHRDTGTQEAGGRRQEAGGRRQEAGGKDAYSFLARRRRKVPTVSGNRVGL
jgi:hypothetical protein